MTYRAFRGCPGYHAFDVQNAIAALKPAIDGMNDAGLIPSDSNAWLAWGPFTLLTTKREAKTAGVTITVRRA